MTDLHNPIFTSLDAAREALEAVRWPNGPFCPHCGAADRIAKVEGEKHRPGLYYCNECKGTFTVTVGTVFERSKIPLTKWWLAVHLLGSSKKGMSSHQLHRMLGVTYKTAWFMSHRIREAMRDLNPAPMGGNGGTVEADETYIGRKHQRKVKAGAGHKHAVVALVERGGAVRSFHLHDATGSKVRPILREHISDSAHLRTDESRIYADFGSRFASHETVKHSEDEYVRGDVHTNTVEGVFSIFKRGMIGTYQHCGEQHLQRYLTEFDFRYSNRTALGVDDKERARRAMKGIEGKRLTYRRTNQRPEA